MSEPFISQSSAITMLAICFLLLVIAGVVYALQLKRGYRYTWNKFPSGRGAMLALPGAALAGLVIVAAELLGITSKEYVVGLAFFVLLSSVAVLSYLGQKKKK